MDQFKRHVAYKVNVSQINNSSFVKQEDQWAPSYIPINDKQVSRVNLMGVVVAVEENGLVVDDGTGRIPLRSFDNSVPSGNIGDAINIIGRPREFNNEKYIVPEIVTKIDTAWLAVRKLEVPFVAEAPTESFSQESAVEENVAPERSVETPVQSNVAQESVSEVKQESPVENVNQGSPVQSDTMTQESEAVESEVVEESLEDPSTKIFNLIKKLDEGEGVDIDKLQSESQIETAEKIISNLLKEGEIFEIKPGRVKVLE
ncbi:hypothetical protein ACFLZX_04025 [Nanoarchaeota archaeon]